MATAERRFHWADYLVFCTGLCISVAIGVYYAIQGQRKTSTTEYLIGGRNMGVFPVAASLVVSFISAIYVLGIPAETYSYGIYEAFFILGYGIAVLISSIFYHPVFYRLGLTSVYEYLELRFSKAIRIVCSIVIMIQMILYSSVVLYAPSIAMSQATGLPYWACILIAAALCTVYTTLGGLKAVLWTDTVQCGIMIIGLTATLIKGSIDLGGLSQALNIAKEDGRVTLANNVPDPLERHSLWHWLFGDIPMSMVLFATNQLAVQRSCSVRTMNKARIAMMFAIPIQSVLMLLLITLGCVAYAYYRGCDPYISGRIGSRNQILGLLVMDVFDQYPGMAGVFLSSIMSAALSTLSSVQNSFAALFLEDLLKPLKLKITGKPLTEREASLATKLTVFCVGIVIMCMSVLAARTGKLVMQLGTASLTLASAPILAVFSLGLSVSFSNTKGAFAGLISGIAILGWIIIGALSIPKTLHPPLPVTTHLCRLANGTYYEQGLYENASVTGFPLANASDMGTAATLVPSVGINRLYRVAYKWYALIGTMTAVIFGTVVSLLTGGWNSRKSIRNDLWFTFRRHGLRCTKNKADERDAIMNNDDKPESETMLQRNL